MKIRQTYSEDSSIYEIAVFSQFFHFLLKHIPQPSEKLLYIKVSRQVHVWQTCTYHVPNIYLNMYLNMYLRIVFCEVSYIYNKGT